MARLKAKDGAVGILPLKMNIMNRESNVGSTHMPGRPLKMRFGRRRNVYIDDQTWQKAVKFGNGNGSEGIRKIFERLKENSLDQNN